MWQKTKEQLPTIILVGILIALLAGGAAYWSVQQMTLKQDAALAPLREQNEALKAASDENHREVVAANQLLKDAI